MTMYSCDGHRACPEKKRWRGDEGSGLHKREPHGLSDGDVAKR